MKRLTFKKENGEFGVVGMNEDNQDEKLYACVHKLKHYEDLDLNPDEIEQLIDEMKDNFDKLNKKYCEECDKIINLQQQLKEKEDKIKTLRIKYMEEYSRSPYAYDRCLESRKQIKKESLLIKEKNKLLEKENQLVDIAFNEVISDTSFCPYGGCNEPYNKKVCQLCKAKFYLDFAEKKLKEQTNDK